MEAVGAFFEKTLDGDEVEGDEFEIGPTIIWKGVDEDDGAFSFDLAVEQW